MASNIDMESAARRSAELETAAEAVEHAKNFVVDIDRRIHMDREGLRALKKSNEHQHPLTQSWLLCPGGVFIKSANNSIMHVLQTEMDDLTSRQQRAQEELKARVVELAHLEGLDTTLERLRGFELRST